MQSHPGEPLRHYQESLARNTKERWESLTQGLHLALAPWCAFEWAAIRGPGQCLRIKKRVKTGISPHTLTLFLARLYLERISLP